MNEAARMAGLDAQSDDVMAALSKMFGDAGRRLVGQTEAQQIAIMALTAILAAMPETAKLNQERLAGVVYALCGAKPEMMGVVQKVGAYLSMVTTLAEKLPAVEAAMKAAQPTDSKRAGGVGTAKKKPN